MDEETRKILSETYWTSPSDSDEPDKEMKMEWVSVKDKLPEDGQDVLVYHANDFYITVGCFESDNVEYYIKSDGSKFYIDDGWGTEIPWAPKGHVTHWMPLPHPPKNT